MALPTFSPNSSRGRELLDTILREAKVVLKDDITTGNLSHTRYYLELANFVTIEKQVANPVYPLRFLQTNIVPKLPGNRLSEDDSLFVFELYGKLVSATFGTKQTTSSPSSEPSAIRLQVAEACAILLPVIFHITMFPSFIMLIAS